MKVDLIFLVPGIIFVLFDMLLFSFFWTAVQEVNCEQNYKTIALDDNTVPTRTWSRGAWIIWGIMLLICIPGTLLFLALGVGIPVEVILDWVARYI